MSKNEKHQEGFLYNSQNSLHFQTSRNCPSSKAEETKMKTRKSDRRLSFFSKNNFIIISITNTPIKLWLVLFIFTFVPFFIRVFPIELVFL